MGDDLIAIGGVVAIAAIGLGLAGRLARSLAPVRRPSAVDRTVDPVNGPVNDPVTGPVNGPVTGPTGHRVDRRSGRSRRSVDPDDMVANWCEDLSRRIRGGDSVLVALTGSTNGPADLVENITAATARGIPVTTGLASHRGRSPALDHALAVLISCVDVGSPAAPALDRTAAVLRDRSATRAERRTHSAQARWSATVLTVLPGAAAAVMAITSPAMRTALASSFGVVCALLGVGFNGAGWLWMRRIVDRVAT